MRASSLTLAILLGTLLSCGDAGDPDALVPRAEPPVADPPPTPPPAVVSPDLTRDHPLRVAIVADPDAFPPGALAEALARRWGLAIRCADVAPVGPVELAFTPEPPANALPPATRRALAPYDVAVFVDVRGGLRLRQWWPDVDQWSAIATQHGVAEAELASRALSLTDDALGWSGRVVAVRQGEVDVALRGSGLLLDRAAPVRTGDYGPLDYHHPGHHARYGIVKGAHGTVKCVRRERLGATLVLATTGWYRAKLGDRWRRLYLPAGRRAIVVADATRRPVAGLVVYASDQERLRRHTDYAGITDAKGALELAAAPGAPRHVHIVSTVEGVDFVFFQGVIPVAGGLPPWSLVLAATGDLGAQATAIRDQRLSREQMQQLRYQIQALLDASAMLVQADQFAPAIAKLDEALALLSRVANADAAPLAATVGRLKGRYAEQLARAQALDQRTAILESVAQADTAIYAGRFADGVALLGTSAKHFPAATFPDHARLIAAKLAQAQRLVAEAGSPLGRARAAALSTARAIDPDKTTPAEIAAIAPHLDLMRTRGIQDATVHYSDAELASKVVLALDGASQAIVASLERTKAAYDAATDVDERGRIYESSARQAALRKAIDALLSGKVVGDRPTSEPDVAPPVGREDE